MGNKKPLKAISRVYSFKSNNGRKRPTKYKKKDMYLDLLDILEYTEKLEKENKQLRKNLHRFAPGTPTVGTYITEQGG